MKNPYRPTPEDPIYDQVSLWKRLCWESTHFNFYYLTMEQLLVLGEFKTMERLYEKNN